MKKIILLLLIISIMTGCSLTNNNESKDTPSPSPAQEETVTGEIADYFPIKENTLYEYEDLRNPGVVYQIYNTYINDGRVQRLQKFLANEAIEVLALTEDQLTVIYANPTSPTIYYPEDITSAGLKFGESVVIKAPLKAGQSWQVNSNETAEIASMSATVETPYGSFDQAMEIVRTSEVPQYVEDSKGNASVSAMVTRVSRDYYVKDIGLVKSIYTDDNGAEGGNQLTSITENAATSISYFHFIPYVTETDYDVVVKERTVEITTNSNPVQLLEEQMKIPDAENGNALISENTKINSVITDRENNRMTLDLSKEFITETNAGAGLENKLISAVVCTAGYFYRIDNVALTIDGGPYESGHIMLEVDQYMPIKPEEGQKAGN